MEKVTFTKEQAHEFESFKALRNTLEEWANDKYDPNAPHSIIHELTFDQVARAYLVGYEIEPEQPKFQSGDKVLWENGIITLTERNNRWDNGGCGLAWLFKESAGWLGESQFRHATIEEIYWFETLDRSKVPGFMLGDVFVRKDGEILALDTTGEIEHAEVLYKQEDFQGVYPSMSFERFPERSEQK